MRVRLTRLLWLLFPLLSGADLFLTWQLLRHGHFAVYESNPIAAWFLGHFGWPGLALFKLTAVAVVLTACAALARRRPRMGTGILSFGCAVLAAVVVYSSFLAGSAQALDEMVRANPPPERLDQQLVWLRHQQALKDRLAQDVIAGRCSLPEAVERLLAATQDRDPGWVRYLRRTYAVDSPRDCLAANLLRHILLAHKGDPSDWDRRAREWVSTYRSLYQVADPPPWQRSTAPPHRRAG